MLRRTVSWMLEFTELEPPAKRHSPRKIKKKRVHWIDANGAGELAELINCSNSSTHGGDIPHDQENSSVVSAKAGTGSPGLPSNSSMTAHALSLENRTSYRIEKVSVDTPRSPSNPSSTDSIATANSSADATITSTATSGRSTSSGIASKSKRMVGSGDGETSRSPSPNSEWGWYVATSPQSSPQPSPPLTPADQPKFSREGLEDMQSRTLGSSGSLSSNELLSGASLSPIGSINSMSGSQSSLKDWASGQLKRNYNSVMDMLPLMLRSPSSTIFGKWAHKM